MRKRYLEPRMRVQIFDGEMLTEVMGDDTNILSAFDEDDEDSGVGDGDTLF